MVGNKLPYISLFSVLTSWMSIPHPDVETLSAASTAHFGYFDQLNCCRVKRAVNHRGFFDFWITKSFWIFFVRKCHQHFFGNDRSKHLSKNYNTMVHAHQKKSRNCFSFWLHFFSLKENRSLPVGILSWCMMDVVVGKEEWYFFIPILKRNNFQTSRKIIFNVKMKPAYFWRWHIEINNQDTCLV